MSEGSRERTGDRKRGGRKEDGGRAVGKERVRDKMTEKLEAGLEAMQV